MLFLFVRDDEGKGGFLDFGFQKKKDRGIQCGGPHLETLEMVV